MSLNSNTFKTKNMKKENLLDLVKDARNNKDISFEEIANRIDVYALQVCKGLSDARLNKNNERIEELSLKKYPKVHTELGSSSHIHFQAEKAEFQREAYAEGYDNALNFKFEDMTVLIDWLKRHKSRNYFEQESPAQIVSDYHHALRQDYFDKTS